jgi:hypothetical protein
VFEFSVSLHLDLDSWWAVSASVPHFLYELPQYHCIASSTVLLALHDRTDLGNFTQVSAHQAFSAISPGGPERIIPSVISYIRFPACWRMLVWPFVGGACMHACPVVSPFHILGACDNCNPHSS